MMLPPTLYILSRNWKQQVLNFLFLFPRENSQLLAINILEFSPISRRIVLLYLFHQCFPFYRWKHVVINWHFLAFYTSKVLKNNLNSFLCNNHMGRMSSICPYLDEEIEEKRDVVISLGSEQSHPKNSKANVLLFQAPSLTFHWGKIARTFPCRTRGRNQASLEQLQQ